MLFLHVSSFSSSLQVPEVQPRVSEIYSHFTVQEPGVLGNSGMELVPGLLVSDRDRI